MHKSPHERTDRLSIGLLVVMHLSVLFVFAVPFRCLHHSPSVRSERKRLSLVGDRPDLLVLKGLEVIGVVWDLRRPTDEALLGPLVADDPELETRASSRGRSSARDGKRGHGVPGSSTMT